TFSLLCRNVAVNPVDNFKISALVSTALVEKLQKILPDYPFSIKWPNDILSGNRKICGILIENLFKGGTIQHCIIGIGLNVNQTNFPGHPQAGSLKMLTQKEFSIQPLWEVLSEGIEEKLYKGLPLSMEEVLETY